MSALLQVPGTVAQAQQIRFVVLSKQHPSAARKSKADGEACQMPPSTHALHTTSSKDMKSSGGLSSSFYEIARKSKLTVIFVFTRVHISLANGLLRFGHSSDLGS